MVVKDQQQKKIIAFYMETTSTLEQRLERLWGCGRAVMTSFS